MSQDLLELGTPVPRDEVLRLLGYRSRGPGPRPQVRARLDSLWARAEALPRPRGTFRVVTPAELQGTGMPAPPDQTAVAVCSIGPAPDMEVARLTAAGDLMAALVIDAFGSAAAEAASDELNRRICAFASGQGLSAAPRESPGYGRWPVTGQGPLLALIGAPIGVTVTGGSMMSPRKSVTFAVRLGDVSAGRDQRRCRRCGMVECQYKDDDGG